MKTQGAIPRTRRSRRPSSVPLAVVAVSIGAVFMTASVAPLGDPRGPSTMAPAPDPAAVAEAAARAELHDAERDHGVDSAEAAVALSRLVTLLNSGADVDRSEVVELARRWVELSQAVHGSEDPAVASALEGLAFSLWRARDFDAARAPAERALAIRENAMSPDAEGLAGDLHLLSEIRRVQGDFGGALLLRSRLGDILERVHGPDSVEMAIHLERLAKLQEATGDLETALADMVRAVTIRETHPVPEPTELAASLNYLGHLRIASGRFDEAETALDRALAIWEAATPPEPANLARALTNLAAILVERGATDAARPLLRRALESRIEAFGSNHILVARTLANLGWLERRAGDRDAARDALRRAVTIQEAADSISYHELADSLRELALVDLADGNDAVALSEALRAERIARDRFRMTCDGLSEREALAQGRARRGGLDIALVAASVLAERDALRDEDVERLSDEMIRSRAVVLDALVERRRALAVDPDTSTAGLVDALQRARRTLVRLSREEPERRSAESLEEQWNAAVADADDAEHALAERSRALRGEIARRRIGLEEVREALPSGSAILSYVRLVATPDGESSVAAPGYTALVLAAEDGPPRFVALGSTAAIDDAVASWYREVSKDPRLQASGSAEEDYRRAARRLRQEVWDPIEPLLRSATRVFVVPDGSLHFLDLGTLVAKDGTYLVESGPMFHYLSTERDLVRADESVPEGSGVLAVGDPDFGPPLPGGRWFDPLPGSRREAAEVVARARPGEPAVLLLGRDADEASLKRLAPTVRVIHLATHAFFASDPSRAREFAESPLKLAGLALAGANRAAAATHDGEDGILTAQEVALLDLSRVSWVVLSACASGRGVVDPNEGVLGLRRAFQIAGARTLVVSLWPVEDETTRRWMGALYAAGAEGASTVEATRRAALRRLEEQRHSGGTTHPFAWAGFVAVGDWR